MRRDCAETRFPPAAFRLRGRKLLSRRSFPGSQLTAAVPTQEQAPAVVCIRCSGKRVGLVPVSRLGGERIGCSVCLSRCDV